MSKPASVGKILAELMERANVGENELARQTGVPQPTIHHILTGESQDPRTGTLEKLAAFFSVTVTQLRGAEPLPWQKYDQSPLANLLSPIELDLLRLFNELIDDQKNEVLQWMATTKQRNEQVYDKLSRMKKSGAV